ncbi:hypothetical protein Tco_0816501 [Tanacetum coccineum]
MKRVSRGYNGVEVPLFPTMLTTTETSPLRITSSPSLSPEPSLSPQHTPSTETHQPTTYAEEAALSPHKSHLPMFTHLDVMRVALSLLNDGGCRGFREKQRNDTEDVRRKEPTRAYRRSSVRVSTVSRQDGTADVSTASEIVMKKPLDYKNRLMRKKKRIARDAEIAKQLQEEYDKAGKKEVVAEVDSAHVIDWNDPSVIRYHALQNRPRSVAEVMKNMIMCFMDSSHSFVPMDSEEEVQRLKRAGQDVEAEPAKRQRTEEVSESVQEQTDEEPKTDELSQEQLNQMVIIVPDEGINVEALQTKYPIIGWEVHSDDTMQFWKIIRVGNHTEVYQVFEDMLKNFDRDDLVKLWSLVQERYNSSGLTEDKEIELWVELKMLFEPNAENLLELQKYMHDPLNWWLYDTCVVHHVSTKKGQDKIMWFEKIIHLTKENHCNC